MGNFWWTKCDKKGCPKYVLLYYKKASFASLGMQGKAYRTVVLIVSYSISSAETSWWQVFRD
jgi:hypothetical protein